MQKAKNKHKGLLEWEKNNTETVPTSAQVYCSINGCGILCVKSIKSIN